MSHTSNAPAGSSRVPWRVSFASFVGTSIEWYDYYIFGLLAATGVFSRLYFPDQDPATGLLLAFLTYAVGFVARPFGGLFAGHFGDKIGRKPMLVLSLMIMGTATLAMGLLPAYAQIGVWAPVLLTVLRLLQGFGAGAEWAGAAVISTEHAPEGRRGFFGSFTQVGGSVGQVLATGAIALVALVPGQQLLTWGWRIPFLLSALLVVVGLIVRLRIVESPVFVDFRQQEDWPRKPPVIEVLRRSPGQVVRSACAAFANNAVIYVVTVFALSYGATQLGIDKSVLLSAVVIASVIDAFAIPGWGALSDRVGRRPVVLVAAGAMMLFAFPFFWLLETGIAPLIWLAFTVAIAGVRAALYAPQPAYFSELFSTGVRYSGASLGTNLATVAMGGTAPLVATALLGAAGGASWPVAMYLIAVALVTFVAVLTSPETLGRDITAGTGSSAEPNVPTAS
jgi:MFS family permease